MNGTEDLIFSGPGVPTFRTSLVPFLQIINLPLLVWMSEGQLVGWAAWGSGMQGFSAPCTDFQTTPHPPPTFNPQLISTFWDTLHLQFGRLSGKPACFSAAIHPHSNHPPQAFSMTLFLFAKSLAISSSTSLLCILLFRVTVSSSFLKDRVCVSVYCFCLGEIFLTREGE